MYLIKFFANHWSLFDPNVLMIHIINSLIFLGVGHWQRRCRSDTRNVPLRARKLTYTKIQKSATSCQALNYFYWNHTKWKMIAKLREIKNIPLEYNCILQDTCNKSKPQWQAGFAFYTVCLIRFNRQIYCLVIKLTVGLGLYTTTALLRHKILPLKMAIAWIL